MMAVRNLLVSSECSIWSYFYHFHRGHLWCFYVSYVQ